MKDKELARDIVRESFAMELESAKAADALAFVARIFAQVTLPYSSPGKEVTAWARRCGSVSLSVQAGVGVDARGHAVNLGLPYGTVPRLLLTWATTEATRTKSPTLTLGRSLSEFMGKLDIVPTGGRWGSITRLREQAQRLFACRVTAGWETVDGDERHEVRRVAYNLVDELTLAWTPRRPEQPLLWESSLTLSDRFFREVTRRPVPVDLRALKALRKSPMKLDAYTWLTYRMSYLEKPTVVPWEGLAAQLGADYGRLRDFKAKFSEGMRDVLAVYPEAKVRLTDAGLRLLPSPPHVLPSK